MTRPPRPEAPPEVVAAAEARSAARDARDWATADRLRGEIEAAGWKVADSGAAFHLVPAHPADIVEEGARRYGRSDAVPSKPGGAPNGLATVVVVAHEDPGGAALALTGLLAGAPAGIDAVLVIDGVSDPAGDALSARFAAEPRVEVVRTSAHLGQGAALNIGLRRAGAPIIVVLDSSVEPTGDVVTPLVEALADEGVAIAGPFGLTSTDLRHFEEAVDGPAVTGSAVSGATGALDTSAVAIEGYLMAFRRADATERGPFDEAFRFYRNLDIWWSLVVRDAGQATGTASRVARVVPGLPLRRHEHLAWTATPPAERDRRSKRNFYRILDRFRDRLDLAAPPSGQAPRRPPPSG